MKLLTEQINFILKWWTNLLSSDDKFTPPLAELTNFLVNLRGQLTLLEFETYESLCIKVTGKKFMPDNSPLANIFHAVTRDHFSIGYFPWQAEMRIKSANQYLVKKGMYDDFHEVILESPNNMIEKKSDVKKEKRKHTIFKEKNSSHDVDKQSTTVGPNVKNKKQKKSCTPGFFQNCTNLDLLKDGEQSNYLGDFHTSENSMNNYRQ